MNIGVIGCGKMGACLVNAIIDQIELSFKCNLALLDLNQEVVERLCQRNPAAVRRENSIESLVRESDVILLCVKPTQVSTILNGQNWWQGKLLLSIVAGLGLSELTQMGGKGIRCVRVMPNTPALIGEGMTAFCAEQSVTKDDLAFVEQLFLSVGKVCSVEEALMDAVTGVSGSGPAFVYTMIEGCIDAAVREGLPREVATKLVCQTFKGATMLVEKSGEHPGVLRDQVTSPGGTTIAGVAALEQHGMRAALYAAIQASTLRSKALKPIV